MMIIVVIIIIILVVIPVVESRTERARGVEDVVENRSLEIVLVSAPLLPGDFVGEPSRRLPRQRRRIVFVAVQIRQVLLSHGKQQAGVSAVRFLLRLFFLVQNSKASNDGGDGERELYTD